MRPAFRSLVPWALAALVMAAAPRVFSSDFALTMMSVMGVMIIFALSYNMLLGETGLLSFGHAVYFGLGGFVAIHAMNAAIHSRLPVPVPAIPLVGGLAGLAFGFLLGLVQTFAVAMNFSLGGFFGVSAPPYLGDLWQVTVAQLAPVIPYLMLVLMLIFRPTGLMGTRES